MEKQDKILLFNRLHPDHFKTINTDSMAEEDVFDEMILSLKSFEIAKNVECRDKNISFGFYNGDIDIIKKAVSQVDEGWVQFFVENERIYCGFINEKPVSFCIVDDMGVHRIGDRLLKIGGPGCVGTLPEYRGRGIGSAMVLDVTRILKNENFDYSYIHFTHVPSWYEKIGYKTIIKWDKNGIRQIL